MILNENAVFSKSCKNPVYIVLMNGKSPLSSIILKATGDYFSHACIAFNDDLDPLYSFGAKSKTMQKGGMGFCISKPTDLSVFNKQAYYAVYVTYVTDEAYAKMKERLSYFTTNANKMIYDYVGLLNVWMHQSSDNRTRAYFCSRFVMDIIGAGIKLDKLPSLYRPQDIASMNNISLVNRGFDFHNYDKKITQKNEKLLKQGKLNPDDIIFESNVLNESDIYYNKDKFDSGETNLCFVTGLSGSGKSTMANGMKAEHYELDDVGFNWNFSDDNLKDYGDLIYTFFKGIGKKYRVGYAEVDDSYMSIYSDFVNYSIQYAKAHKNIKFVIEGVQLFQWINPKDLVDYAVYIKGTSRLISTYRAAKRNAGFENNTKDKINAIKKQVMGDLKYGKDFESRLKTWRKFFTNMQKKNIHEDVSSVIQKDFKSKHDMNLSQFEKMRLSDAAIQVYKQKLPSLSHVRINNNTKGYIWIDKKTDMPAAIVNVEEKDDGFTWIQAFEIFVPYKGHGLSKDILNVAIRELKATNLSVNKDNQVAIKVYKSYGFKTYKTTEAMYFMSIDKNAFDDDDDEDIYDESVTSELKELKDSESKLNSFRKYFEKLVNESTIEDFEIEAETGFYDKHNRWNPIVIINGEQYRHRVECLIMRQNKLFVAKSNTGVLLIPGGGVDKSLSDEEQVYNECKEEARILVENIKPTGYAYLRRTGVSESAKRLPKEQQWVGSYTEIYIADYAKDFTGFIDYCDRDSEMIRGDFRPISEIIDKLVPEWKLALIDANYISVATEALKTYKDPKLALKRRMGIKRNNAAKLGDFSNAAKSAPTPQAQTISVPSPAVSSSAPSPAKPAQTTEETKEIPETVKANANRLLCKEIASYPKFSGCYYNMDYPLYNGNGHAIVGWKMTGVHYNDFDSFNKYRDRIYEYCSKIFEDTNPGYGLKMDKKTNCIYITEI